MNDIKVTQKPIADLIPYSRNPRRNDEAVPMVMNSIKEFGFKVPIVVDKNNIIVCGHTRFKAALKLGLETVPCIVADDLSDEQIKAFRLADNKVSEKAEWDFEILSGELDDIINIDMDSFGFESIEFEEPEEDDSEKQNERERTGNAYNLDEYDELRAIGFYQMPTLERIDYVPDDLVGFNYVLNSDRYESGVHFYIDDYQFERIWASPQMYVDKLAQFDCILTPDFSLYMDMPMAMKIWNVYRSRLIGQIYQDRGLRVIPTVSWAEPETFTFCFDGIPSNSTISVSTIGVKRSKEATKIWTQGMDEAMKRLKPKNVLVYGGDIGYDFKGANVKYYDNHVTEKMKKLKNI